MINDTFYLSHWAGIFKFFRPLSTRFSTWNFPCTQKLTHKHTIPRAKWVVNFNTREPRCHTYIFPLSRFCDCWGCTHNLSRKFFLPCYLESRRSCDFRKNCSPGKGVYRTEGCMHYLCTTEFPAENSSLFLSTREFSRCFGTSKP